MSGHMMKTTVPTPGTNKLTERLLAQGVKLDDPSTWPEGVWACEINNFGYSREWRFTPTWESPCGLLIRSHGDMWGDTWAEGEFKCSENDNPLFRCPVPGKPCPHRKRLPHGINCQFHRTDREWNEAESVERLWREHDEGLRRQWEADCARYPEWDGVCCNIREEELPDGTARRTARYRVDNCIQMRCANTQCPCRNGAKRDTRPANIFYDRYVAIRYTEGMLEHEEKRVMKGLKIFDKPVAMTDAEIALAMWKHDPDSNELPSGMRVRLDATESIGHQDGKVAYFVKHHRYWDGHRDVEMRIEIRNIRIARSDVRDMMQDLQDVREGISVEHASDLEKAAKAAKQQGRHERKIRNIAKAYVKMQAGGDGGRYERLIRKEGPEIRRAALDEAARMLERKRAKAEHEAAKGEQMSLFDTAE